MMPEQLWRRCEEEAASADLVMWEEPQDEPIFMRRVAAGALLIPDGYDAALERYCESFHGENWLLMSERARGIHRDLVRPHLRAACGEGDR